MSDSFKTLREPLIQQQKKKTDEKRDELIERLKDNQDRIIQAIEYNPQRALTYEGQTLSKLDWEGKKPRGYGFIDTDDEEEEEIDSDDEEDKEKPSTSKTTKTTSVLNLDKGINDDYNTLLRDKCLDLPSEIFNEQKNVDDTIEKVKAKIKRSEDYIKDNSTKNGETLKKLSKVKKTAYDRNKKNYRITKTI